MKNIKLKKGLLILLLFLIICPFVGETHTMALKQSDIYFSFDAKNGVTEGTSSAWAKYGDQTSAWNKIFKEYRGVIMGVSGIATLTMVILFIINFMKLGASAGNPQAKHQATIGLLWTGIAAAGAGGVTIFVGVASNLLN